MRILHVSADQKTPGIGGGSSHVWGVAKALRKLGHEVTILGNYDPKRPSEEIIDGISVERLNWHAGNKTLSAAKLFMKVFLRTIKFCANNDCMVYERLRILGGAGALAARLMRKQSILEVNDPIIESAILEGKLKEGSLMARFAKAWRRMNFSTATKVIGTHESMLKDAPEDKAEIVTWGVDTDEFIPLPMKKKNYVSCLFVGMFYEWHGYQDILQAAELVLKKKKNVKFLFAGAGPGLKECKQFVEKHKLGKNVQFLGLVAHDELPNVYAKADICLAPSNPNKYAPTRTLGFYFTPMKIFEAMACGKPVITTNVDNVREIIKDGINGYLIQPGDYEALAKKILLLAKNKSLAERMGRINREESVKKYDWVTNIKNVLAIKK